MIVVALALGGFWTVRMITDGAREDEAHRFASAEGVRVQTVLARARADVVGVASTLADQPTASQERFRQTVGRGSRAVGLVNALWVERVPASERRAYERRLGASIVNSSPGGAFVPAPRAPSYLVATYTAGPNAALRRGLDVSNWPSLGAALSDPSSRFAVTASRRGRLGRDTGFYIVRGGTFGQRPGRRGSLVIFAPAPWLAASLSGAPHPYSVRLAGRHLTGDAGLDVAASSEFSSLGQPWRVLAATRTSSGADRALPWLALAWPFVIALIATLVGVAVTRQRRAERRAGRFFELSLEPVAVAGLDGFFKEVNPALVRALGYPEAELLGRPFLEFAHPDDRERSEQAVSRLAEGVDVVQFDNHCIRGDGTDCWLQWSSKPVPEEGLIYCVARDVTEHRQADQDLRDAAATIEAANRELRELAEQQAALRRVATLITRGATATEVFAAVAAEMARRLGSQATRLLRYEPDGSATVVAASGPSKTTIPPGTVVRLEGENVPALVLATRHAAHMEPEGLATATGDYAELLRALGVKASIGVPVVVDDRLWGAMVAAWPDPVEHWDDTERRMAEFTELLATAIANAEGRDQLAASRIRVVAASDETRRRIERDLHDGIQQRLVSIALELRSAAAQVPTEQPELQTALAHAADGLGDAVANLREISRGIHPASLSRGGLRPALKGLARRSAIPVELETVGDRRLPEPIEIAAYYVVSEALANAAKHAHASVVRVHLDLTGPMLDLVVHDDGRGGATLQTGSGLTGLHDRVDALGGSLELTSTPERGTRLHARIPTSMPHMDPDGGPQDVPYPGDPTAFAAGSGSGAPRP
ncbi:MAG: PAS domain S-box protein [Baekduiaceae bacterium]